MRRPLEYAVAFLYGAVNHRLRVAGEAVPFRWRLLWYYRNIIRFSDLQGFTFFLRLPVDMFCSSDILFLQTDSLFKESIAQWH